MYIFFRKLFCQDVRSFFYFKFPEIAIWDALHYLVPFVQFKKREKHPWSNVTFSKVSIWSLQLYF